VRQFLAFFFLPFLKKRKASHYWRFWLGFGFFLRSVTPFCTFRHSSTAKEGKDFSVRVHGKMPKFLLLD